MAPPPPLVEGPMPSEEEGKFVSSSCVFHEVCHENLWD